MLISYFVYSFTIKPLELHPFSGSVKKYLKLGLIKKRGLFSSQF